MGARAQVSFFLPNFDVIRTKEVEMEPVSIACFGRGETVFSVFTVFESFTVCAFSPSLTEFF